MFSRKGASEADAFLCEGEGVFEALRWPPQFSLRFFLLQLGHLQVLRIRRLRRFRREGNVKPGCSRTWCMKIEGRQNDRFPFETNGELILISGLLSTMDVCPFPSRLLSWLSAILVSPKLLKTKHVLVACCLRPRPLGLLRSCPSVFGEVGRSGTSISAHTAQSLLLEPRRHRAGHSALPSERPLPPSAVPVSTRAPRMTGLLDAENGCGIHVAPFRKPGRIRCPRRNYRPTVLISTVASFGDRNGLGMSVQPSGGLRLKFPGCITPGCREWFARLNVSTGPCPG